MKRWLQGDEYVDQMENYGCHCRHGRAATTTGRPLDGTDQACFRYNQCNHCLLNLHGSRRPCNSESFGYAVDFRESGSIQCSNLIGSCRRNICECDRQFAEEITKHRHSVDVKFVNITANESICLPLSTRGKHSFVKCCGNRTQFPFNQPQHDHQCCDGPLAKPFGQC